MSDLVLSAEELNTIPADETISTTDVNADVSTVDANADTAPADVNADTAPTASADPSATPVDPSTDPSAPPASTVPANVFDDVDPGNSGELWISNVLKPLTPLGKPDVRCLDVIFVKTVNIGKRTGLVYHYDTKQVSKIDVTTECVGDCLPDGGVITHITRGNEKRVYGTIRLTLDDLLDKFGDRIDAITWEVRTKTRKPKDADDTAEVG